jgi:hypothetical protein
MNARLTLLAFPLALAGCWGESESSCLDRLTKNLSSSQILAEVGLQLVLIAHNDDLNVCDYTVLGNSIVKID